MLERYKKILLIMYFGILIVVGYSVFPFWAVMLSVWFFAILVILLARLQNNLSNRELKIFWLIALLYPLAETLTKIFILGTVIPNIYFALNIFEHTAFSFCLTILLLPFAKPWLRKLSVIGQFVLIVGLVVVIGNLNEFLEFFIRIIFSLQYNFSEYYPDTIKDMAVNVAGAILGYAAVAKFRKTQ